VTFDTHCIIFSEDIAIPKPSQVGIMLLVYAHITITTLRMHMV